MVVQSSPVPDPPEDGSSIAYTMIEMKEKTNVAPGTTFDFNPPIRELTAQDAPPVVRGDCTQGYSIVEYIYWPGKLLAFDAGVTCQDFESTLKDGIGIIKLAFSEPEAPLSVVEVLPW